MKEWIAGFLVVLLILTALFLTSCAGSNMGEGPSPQEEEASLEASQATERPAPSSSAASLPRKEEEDVPVIPADPPQEAGNNPDTSHLGGPDPSLAIPDPEYIPNPVDDFFLYLYDALNYDQHGGIDNYPDHVLIWVVDEAAVKAAVGAYEGGADMVAYKPADYSMRQLLDIIHDLEASEIKAYTNGIGLGGPNRLHIVVDGYQNEEHVVKFLETYPQRDAVTYVVQPEGVENPLA